MTRIRDMLQALMRVRNSVDPRDAMLLVGAALLTWGLQMVYTPLALIVPGTGLAGYAVWLDWPRRQRGQ